MPSCDLPLLMLKDKAGGGAGTEQSHGRPPERSQAWPCYRAAVGYVLWAVPAAGWACRSQGGAGSSRPAPAGFPCCCSSHDVDCRQEGAVSVKTKVQRHLVDPHTPTRKTCAGT